MTAVSEQRLAHDVQTERLRARVGRIARLVGIAAIVAIFLRSFLYEPFTLPSRSMAPNLQPGDTVFVAKWPYGYSRHSLPLSPALLSGRLFAGHPQRGDIIVFKTPRDGGTDFIKRVIGLPGDTIAMRSGVLHINGQPILRRATAAASGTAIEILPNGQSFVVQTDGGLPGRQYLAPIKVPSDHIFVVGDNRNASADSRYSLAEGGIGLVPLGNVIGRADIILLSRSWSRIGTRL